MRTKEEIHRELESKVENYIQIFGTCSQSAFQALNDEFYLKADDAALALKPFAGGPGGNGDLCGAVTGALLALGFYFETKVRDFESHLFPEYSMTLMDQIEKEYGSTRCYRIQNHQFGRYYDFLKPDELKLFLEAAQNGKCTGVIKKAVLIAADIILSYDQKEENSLEKT